MTKETKGLEIGNRLPCTKCVPFCKEQGCYQELVEMVIGGDRVKVWSYHCKAEEKSTKKGLRILDSIKLKKGIK